MSILYQKTDRISKKEKNEESTQKVHKKGKKKEIEKYEIFSLEI